MQDFIYLSNQLLISTPSMNDPYFEKTVIYICEHSEKGAMGIVINHPMSITIADLLIHMEIIKPESDMNELPPIIHHPVLAGGPVQRERGFVIHKPAGQWQSSFITPNGLAITTSRDILQALIEHKAPEQMLIALGYTGWEAGQLEEELMSNTWINCPANLDLIFNTPPEECWEVAGKLIGVDLSRLTSSYGHS